MVANGARLAEMALPDFGRPDAMPVIPPSVYAERFDRLRVRMGETGHDFLVVYADREHSANLSYLTGFDPRFEEAVLVVGGEGEPLLLAGNECVGMGRAAPLPMRVEVFQDLSLPGQPRDRSRPLGEILGGEGIGPGARVGVVGWKTFDSPEAIEAPAYLVDHLRDSVGADGRVVNANSLLIDAQDGLRVANEIEQLVYFEYAACHTSDGVRNLLWNLRPGLTEQDAVALLGWNGSPLSCHLMLTAGERARLGLLSPGDRPIARGDPFTVAYGVWGALNCRAGFVVQDGSGLPGGVEDYVERLVAPYFEAIVEWYQALHIGQRGSVLHDIIQRRLGDPFFGIFLNPGHQIHLDEWVNTPVGPGSEIELRSGMALQVDVIPATGTAHFTTNIEDGIALADEALRDELARRHPEVWARIKARRAFMDQSLGIELHADVLPLSNIPAYLPPYLLSPHRALTMRS